MRISNWTLSGAPGLLDQIVEEPERVGVGRASQLPPIAYPLEPVPPAVVTKPELRPGPGHTVSPDVTRAPGP